MSGIQIKDLSFAYEAGGKLILKDINTEIGEGEFVCILGQSGCGKSTLLRLLAGLETATTGEILSDGVAIGEPSLNKGVVFQDYGLFPWMSAGENILLALKQRYPKRDKKELKEIAVNMIKAVGLDESIYKKLSLVIAVIFGTIMGLNKKIREALHPVIYAFSVIPSILLSPFVLLLSPTLLSASIFLVVYNIVWATLFATITGIMTIDKRYLDKAATLELTGVKRFMKVILPAASPSILAGFVNSLRSSFVMLVFAEMYGGGSGMGYFVKKNSELGVFANTWVGFIFMVIVLVVVMQIFEKVKEQLLKWTID